MNDHLDRETSVSVELSEAGVRAKAQSRFVAAIDRLGGNLAELINAPLERYVGRQRAISKGELKLIETATKHGVEFFELNPEFAARASQKYFDKIFKKQENTDHVLLEAINDLREDPPTDEEAQSGNSNLSDEFLDRFEKYAEDASTEQLRQKWGRVLSAEVRKPGSFSLKVLRIVDEIDAQTASSFERICKYRLHSVIPKVLSGQISFTESAALTSAGLLIEPGLGQVWNFAETKEDGGRSIWFAGIGRYGIAIPGEAVAPPAQPSSIVAIQNENGKPAIPVYCLTDAGFAVSMILPDDQRETISALALKIKEALPSLPIQIGLRKADQDNFDLVYL